MKTPIVVAIVALAVLIVWELVAMPIAIGRGFSVGYVTAGVVLRVAINAAFVAGIARSRRLAWQGVRFFSMFAAVLTSMAAVQYYVTLIEYERSVIGFLGLLLYPLCSYTIFFSLGTKGAKEHFRLKCPNCGGKAKAANLFYTKAMCKSCGNIW